MHDAELRALATLDARVSEEHGVAQISWLGSDDRLHYANSRGALGRTREYFGVRATKREIGISARE